MKLLYVYFTITLLCFLNSINAMYQKLGEANAALSGVAPILRPVRHSLGEGGSFSEGGLANTDPSAKSHRVPSGVNPSSNGDLPLVLNSVKGLAKADDKKEQHKESLLDQNKKLRNQAKQKKHERFAIRRKTPDRSKSKTGYLVDHIQFSGQTTDDYMSSCYYGLLIAITNLHKDVKVTHDQTMKKIEAMDGKMDVLSARVTALEKSQSDKKENAEGQSGTNS
jgi:hypothetical protein